MDRVMNNITIASTEKKINQSRFDKTQLENAQKIIMEVNQIYSTEEFLARSMIYNQAYRIFKFTMHFFKNVNGFKVRDQNTLFPSEFYNRGYFLFESKNGQFSNDCKEYVWKTKSIVDNEYGGIDAQKGNKHVLVYKSNFLDCKIDPRNFKEFLR
jgi:hypothetical protein